jgi:(1->4)-alpha-D-glucan 1-alpha-D-glucosylmutase
LLDETAAASDYQVDSPAALADDRAKLQLIRRTLALRVQQPDLFRDGDYQPLTVKGTEAAHVCAYARSLGDAVLIVVVPRLTVKLLKGGAELPLGRAVWGDTVLELPEALWQRSWHNLLTHATLAPAPQLVLGELLVAAPVALLIA